MIFNKLLDRKHEAYWFWGIGLFALFVEVSFHALLPVSISNDSYGYLNLSQHMTDPNISWERSVGYPAFLRILGTNLFDNLIPVMLAQAALAVAVPLIVFKILTRFGLQYAILGGVISCLYFYNFVVSLFILTEPLYVFAIAIYAFFLVKYFQRMTLWNLMFVIVSCWLIAIVRLSGTQYFLSFLVGMGWYVIASRITKNPEKTKLGLVHCLVAVVVFLSVSWIQNVTTNRIPSIVWPHFVFNWIYDNNGGVRYGIAKPENGPATKKLFQEIQSRVTDSPAFFETLKASASAQIKTITPEKNGKYSQESVTLLMNDLIYNTLHPVFSVRSWEIEGILVNSHGIVIAMKMLGDAIVEAVAQHPEIIVKRIDWIVRKEIWKFFAKGIEVNDVSFPTAYNQQIPTVINDAPNAALMPGIYKQWAYDLYQHLGNSPVTRDFEYSNKFPTSIHGAIENIKLDNLIGLGHYVGVFGMQILRLCWVFIALGLLVWPFTKMQSLLASLLCASIIPPIASVFLSEVDDRHLLMTSPIQIVTAVIVLYSVVLLWKQSSVFSRSMLANHYDRV